MKQDKLILQRYGIWAVVGLTAVLLALFSLHQQQVAGQLGVPLDDAWIHYRFARNISSGHGFSYNPGVPTPGSTAPLWTVLLAGVGLLTDTPLVPSLLLSALFLLLTVWLVYRLMRALDASVPTALLAALGTALSGRLLWAGLSGMEVTLFCALSFGAMYAFYKRGLTWQSALWVALASQVRPEAHLLFLIFLAAGLWQIYVNSPRISLATFQALLTPLAVYAAINLPYTLFSLSVTGRPLPNTFYAKSDSNQLFSVRTLRELLRIHFRDNAFLFVLIPIGLVLLGRRSRVAVAWLVGLFFITPLVVPFLWHHGRYTMPLIPFQMMAGAFGAEWLIGQLRARWRQRVAWQTAVFLLVVLAGAVRLPFWANMLALNSREILETDIAVGHWLAQHTPPDALIAVDDIGAIGYLSNRELFDLNGLISPQMWPVMNGTEAGLARDAATVRLLVQVQPDYLVIFPEWHWNIATHPYLAREVVRFTTETQTIIGAKRVLVYEVVEWPFAADGVPEVDTAVRFGDSIQLLGFDVQQGDTLDVTLYWTTNALIADSYDVFVHLYDDAGRLVTQSDGAPASLLLPTPLWQPGDVIRDRHALSLPDRLANGRYQLATGLFHRPTGLRLPAAGDALIENDALFLREIVVGGE